MFSCNRFWPTNANNTVHWFWLTDFDKVYQAKKGRLVLEGIGHSAWPILTYTACHFWSGLYKFEFIGLPRTFCDMQPQEASPSRSSWAQVAVRVLSHRIDRHLLHALRSSPDDIEFVHAWGGWRNMKSVTFLMIATAMREDYIQWVGLSIIPTFQQRQVKSATWRVHKAPARFFHSASYL